MPKLKTNRGAAKRFKVTGSGKVKRYKAYASHLLVQQDNQAEAEVCESQSLVDKRSLECEENASLKRERELLPVYHLKLISGLPERRKRECFVISSSVEGVTRNAQSQEKRQDAEKEKKNSGGSQGVSRFPATPLSHCG